MRHNAAGDGTNYTNITWKSSVCFPHQRTLIYNVFVVQRGVIIARQKWDRLIDWNWNSVVAIMSRLTIITGKVCVCVCAKSYLSIDHEFRQTHKKKCTKRNLLAAFVIINWPINRRFRCWCFIFFRHSITQFHRRHRLPRSDGGGSGEFSIFSGRVGGWFDCTLSTTSHNFCWN